MKNLIILKTCFLISQVIWSQSNDCIDASFAPLPGEKYVLSAWVKDDITTQAVMYTGKVILRDISTSGTTIYEFLPSGPIIDGWQRIIGEFEVQEEPDTIQIELISADAGSSVSFFDDIRIFPYNGNLKSFVYDPVTQRLMAELDENNYATLYEYDKEGGLIRVKKETERGVYTIQETRSGNSKLNTPQ